MRHPHAKSLNIDETRKIRNAIMRILVKEQLDHIPIIIKPDIWKTCYEFKRKTKDGVTTIFGDSLNFGGKFLTGASYPARIYIYKDTGKGWKFFSYSNPRDAMLATIVASTILEEIAHASTRRLYVKSDAHGEEFYRAYKRHWRAYFDVLHFQMIGIYGLEGDY